MSARAFLRTAAVALVALLCLLGMSAHAASGPISDRDTHYFVLVWSNKYPMNYLWSGNDLCNWEGVSCDTVKQQVTMLFAKLGMTGTIPTFGSRSTFNPANVKVVSVNLAYNTLTGNFPAHYGQVTNLQELYLTGNPLSGTIPQAWNNLANLAVLELSETKACGNLPNYDATSLRSLQYMHFTGNSLMRGTVPASLATFGRVSFNTSGCNLCGCLPTAFSTNLYMRVQLSYDQPAVTADTCATSNACTPSDLSCVRIPSAASVPVAAAGSVAALVMAAVASMLL